jgi:hypothetical protein
MEITDANSFIKADTSYVYSMDATTNITFTEEISIEDNFNKGHETVINFDETRINATRLEYDADETKVKFFNNETTVMSKTVSNDSMEIGSNETINMTRNQIFHETMICFNNQTLNKSAIEKNNKTMLNETSVAFDKTINQTRQNETLFVPNSLDHTKFIDTTHANETTIGFNCANQTKLNETAIGFNCTNQTKINETAIGFNSTNQTKLNETTIGFNCANQTKINETAIGFNSTNQTKLNETVSNLTNLDQTANQTLNDKTKSFNQSKLLDTTSSNLSLADKIKQNATFHLSINGNQSRLEASTNQSFSRADVEFKSTDEQDLILLNKMRSDKIFIMETLEQMRKVVKECKEKKAQEDQLLQNKIKEEEAVKKLNKELKARLNDLRKETYNLKLTTNPMCVEFSESKLTKCKKGNIFLYGYS